MTLTKTETFEETNTITLGFHLSKLGYSSIDTREDASYFGNWVNLEELTIITYLEGDIYKTKGTDKREFKQYLLTFIKWYQDRKEFLGIDPGLNQEKKDSLINFGLSSLIH